MKKATLITILILLISVFVFMAPASPVNAAGTINEDQGDADDLAG
ncbi:MAG: hypothetical protein V1838_03550 [Patescibacteria group bacterium]